MHVDEIAYMIRRAVREGDDAQALELAKRLGANGQRGTLLLIEARNAREQGRTSEALIKAHYGAELLSWGA